MNPKLILVDSCQYSSNYNNCLLDALARKGMKILYATTVSPHDEPCIPDGVEVRYWFFHLARTVAKISPSNILRKFLRAIEYPFNLSFLIAYVLSKRIRLVHYMWAVLPTMDLFAIRILKIIGCKVVYTAHNPFPHEFKKSHVKTFSRIYQNVDHVIALTNFTRDEIVKHSGVAEEKVTVIGHGDFNYVFSKYESNENLSKLVREKAGKRRIIAFFGIIRRYKGIEYFIEAFSLIKKLRNDTFFLIAGSSRFENEKRLNELLRKSCESDDIHVDFRYMPIPDLKAYLSVTDVLVQPYISASQSGNTIMAYSLGIPVIATNVGGLGEMVKDGLTGYLVHPEDPQAIADAVKKTLEKDNYERLSKNAKRFAAQEYGWDKIANETIDIYRKLGG